MKKEEPPPHVKDGIEEYSGTWRVCVSVLAGPRPALPSHCVSKPKAKTQHKWPYTHTGSRTLRMLQFWHRALDIYTNYKLSQVCVRVFVCEYVCEYLTSATEYSRSTWPWV